MTLYYFTVDAENKSNASVQVIANWPVFNVPEVNVPPSPDAADFGTITRDDGDMQATFMGWPLYYFVQDMAPGDVLGQGLNDVWFVIDPENFMPPMHYALVSGWYMGEEVVYYDFGANSPLMGDMVEVEPIYVLITGMDSEGNPQFVSGQRNIIDVVPGDDGYSDFWRVNMVTVPEDYVANTFMAAMDVLDSGYPITETDLVVNCPVVMMPESSESMTIDLVAENVAFDKSQITVPAGAMVTIVFENKESIPHNFALYETSAATMSLFVGEIISGPQTIEYTFTAPMEPGDYFFPL
jgi:plastocyanin